MKSLENEGNVVEGHTPIDRSICTLGIDVPRVELLPKRESIHVCTQQCTNVYTTVYTRVHNLALSISSAGLIRMYIRRG